METVGQKIINARIAKGFTQEDVAELAKLNLRTIQRIENDQNIPTSKTLQVICKALEIETIANFETQNPIDKRRILNMKLLLPYNWWHFRSIGIYADNGKLKTNIKHGENLEIRIDDDVKKVIVKLDFFRSEIEIPANESVLYLTVFINFRDYFPFIFIDTLKRKCLTGRFVTAQALENFDLSFYQNAQNWVLISKINRPNLRLGLFLSVSLLIVSVIEQKNEYQDLLFFIGLEV